MTIFDAHKLIRLRSDLGDKTSFVRALIESFEADVAELRLAAEAPLSERANIVHQATGSAAMLVPMDVVVRLNDLENALRSGDSGEIDFDAVADNLDAIVEALVDWVDQAPPDGQSITAPA